MSADLTQAYRDLSLEARALMWEIMNGDRDGAHPVTFTEAECEAIAAKCIVSDGVHIWVTQEACRFVGVGSPSPSAPTDTEVKLARGVLALLRAHEGGGEPSTWEVSEAAWGDGRMTLEVRNRTAYMTRDGRETYGTGLVCQFRPDDSDGTRQDAEACVASAARGVSMARDVLARHRDAQALRRKANP